MPFVDLAALDRLAAGKPPLPRKPEDPQESQSDRPVETPQLQKALKRWMSEPN
jgi:hypothetical protein